MANATLYDQAKFQVPVRVLDEVRTALAATPSAVGVNRARGLLSDPSLNYSAAKRIKSDLEAAGAAQQPAYALAGGRTMLAWLNQVLTQARQGVVRSQTVRSNAGQENQFRATHEKNGTGTAAPASISQGTGPVRRLELYETMDSAVTAATTPAQALAQALVGVYPDLRFTLDSSTGGLVITTLELQITIQQAQPLDEGFMRQMARQVALAGALTGAATVLPHSAPKTAAQAEHNRHVEDFEKVAKYAKRKETTNVTDRMTAASTPIRPEQPVA